MKNFKTLQISALCLLMGIFISSCGIMKTNDFTSQKYTNFKKGEATVSLNKEVKEKKNVELTNETTAIEEVSTPTTIAIVEQLPVIESSKPESKKEVLKDVKFNNFMDSEKAKVKRNNVVPFLAKRFFNNANTASVAHDDVELLLFVILAIILPPLCVFLARGMGTEFLLDLILTILFWVPGVVYALLIVFDVV